LIFGKETGTEIDQAVSKEPSLFTGDQRFESPTGESLLSAILSRGRNRLELRQIIGYLEPRRFARNDLHRPIA
jgi:hypothetical protein